MKEIFRILIIGFIISCFAGCETLEETYDEFTGDGPIRYVGKCANVNVESGWNRLTVTWENSLDPKVVNNRITCVTESYSYDTLVAANVSECSIRNLSDGTYAVTVQAVDEAGNTSLAEPVYGRPYTYTHEAVTSFTRGISKYFFVKNNLVLIYGTWDDNIVNFQLEYTRTNGRPGRLQLGEEEFKKKYRLLEEVDVSQPIVLKRVGRIEGCPDNIPLEDYSLKNELNLLSDFKMAIRERYGETDPSIDFLNRTDLELDYDLVSMEDILAFPNLKTLYLGKNRYMLENTTTNWSVVTDVAKSLFCIEVAKNILGLEVKRYGEHYFPIGTANITDAGRSELPVLNYADTEGWSVTCTPEVPNFNETNLLDNDPTTIWKPRSHTGNARTFELIVDMQSAQNVNGLKVVQENASQADLNFLPKSIEISVSSDKKTWTSVTHSMESTLGNAPGETTLIHFTEMTNTRYIRVKVSDQRDGNDSNTSLADIIPFTNN